MCCLLRPQISTRPPPGQAARAAFSSALHAQRLTARPRIPPDCISPFPRAPLSAPEAPTRAFPPRAPSLQHLKCTPHPYPLSLNTSRPSPAAFPTPPLPASEPLFCPIFSPFPAFSA